MKSNDVTAVQQYYNRKPESNRFDTNQGKLEYERTKDILLRYLPRERRRILDIGGGVGHYAFWLASLGYQVTLVDLSDEQVALVEEKNSQVVDKLHSVLQGDIRDLPFPDNSFDAVLNMGPMYHLQERSDRLTALQSTQKVVKQTGLVVAAYISRFASLIDGYNMGIINDPAFRAIVDADLVSGKHEPATDAYFTEAYFHRLEEITEELHSVGFKNTEVVAVEGFAWMMGALDEHMNDEEKRKTLFRYLQTVEKEKTLIGSSAHLLSLSWK